TLQWPHCRCFAYPPLRFNRLPPDNPQTLRLPL
ncbi:MAG: hypothetical protein, partial [Olavius algarvensis Gamma 1 endosymbiont]